MITALDTQNWSSELVTGNAEFIQLPNGNIWDGSPTLYIISNVRTDNSFVVLKANPSPPTPGYGSSFTSVASYTFPQPNISFDPVAAFDNTTGYIHIVGMRNTPTLEAPFYNPNQVDLIKFTYHVGTGTLLGPIVLNTGSRIRGAYDAVVLANTDYAVAVCLVNDITLGESLEVLELTSSDVLVSQTTIASSPTRSGDGYDAVSIVTPGSNNLELYYETHPKVITFNDQIFSINFINRTSGVWNSFSTVLTQYSGRYADNRLTVIADNAGNRYMAQIFWSQQNHPDGIVGNAFLGYKPSGLSWGFNTNLGSTLNGSIIQGSLLVDQALAVNYVYLLQPFDDIHNPPAISTAWPLHVATVDIPNLGFTEVPGYYNDRSFTWLRGTKSLLDNQSVWAVVGEQETALSNSPYYVSLFNVPPIAQLTPTDAVVWRGGSYYSTDFSVVTGFSITNDVLTINAINDFSSGQEIALYGFTGSPYLNGNTVTVLTSTSTQFTANFTHTNTVSISPPSTGFAAALIPGLLTLNASGSTDASLDPLGYTWSDSFSPAADIVITPSGPFATLFIADAVGPEFLSFHVYASVTDLVYSHPPSVASTRIFTPANVPPTITFSSPTINVVRNALVTLSPVYTGLTDPDDVPTYLWVQTSGTPITVVNGYSNSTLEIDTGGVIITGETLTFSVTANDGINPAVTASITVNVEPYLFSQGEDTLQLSRSIWTGTISQRNTVQAWGNLDISVFYTDLQSIKRISVLDGTDRYILISPYSVMVYGLYPNSPIAVLLYVCLTPNNTLIQDAVHTEEDYTLVLDNTNTIYQFSASPVIYNDNPSAAIDLSDISSLSFVDMNQDNSVHILSTVSFGGNRVLTISGEQGALLLQVNTNSLAVGGFLELTTADHFLYGADKVQFVRWVGLENLRTGTVLLGTIANNTAEITKIEIAEGSPADPSALIVTAINTFVSGNVVVLSGLQNAKFLNGQEFVIISATSTQFIVSTNFSSYVSTPDTGLAVSQNSGTTYETLINLGQGRIIGTWDKSKLINQFVNSGEILFDPDSTYAGRLIPPILLPPTLTITNNVGLVTITWVQERSDLCTGYVVEYSFDNLTYNILTQVNSGSIQSITIPLTLGLNYYLRVQALSPDGNSGFSNVEQILVAIYLNPPTITTITSAASGIAVVDGWGNNFGVDFGGVSGYNLTVNWSAINPSPSQISFFTLQMQTDGGAFATIGTITPSTVSSFVTNVLVSGHTYGFQIAAYVPSQSRETGFSPVVSVTL